MHVQSGCEFPIMKVPGKFMNVSAREHRAFKEQIFFMFQDYYSNTNIITILI